LSFRQPRARLSAMIALKMAVSAPRVDGLALSDRDHP
jgi:hypothetical protein